MAISSHQSAAAAAAASASLLPAGFVDLLPSALGGQASAEASLAEIALLRAQRAGYWRVKPPLLEYETSMLAGPGAVLTRQTFRLMDPVSHEMLALRSDLTPQIARLAASRMADIPRPLRLCYSGEVVRSRAGQVRTARQFRQLGAELFGSLEPAADVEIIMLAAEALAACGISDVTIDLCLPTLVPALLAAVADVPADALFHALARRDRAEIIAAAHPISDLCLTLLDASGDPKPALAALEALPLPASAMADRNRLRAVLTRLSDIGFSGRLQVDLLEQRGFEYHSGLSYTFFAGPQGGSLNGIELGRGGRYRARALAAWTDGEPAVGFTLYLDSLLSLLPSQPMPRRIFAPLHVPMSLLLPLRNAGEIVVVALQDLPADALPASARALQCSAILHEDGRLEELT